MTNCRCCRKAPPDPLLGRFCWNCFSRHSIAHLEEVNDEWHAKQVQYRPASNFFAAERARGKPPGPGTIVPRPDPQPRR